MFAVKCVMCGGINKPIPKAYEKIYLHDDKEVEVGLYKCCYCDFKWKKVISPLVCLIGDSLALDSKVTQGEKL